MHHTPKWVVSSDFPGKKSNLPRKKNPQPLVVSLCHLVLKPRFGSDRRRRVQVPKGGSKFEGFGGEALAHEHSEEAHGVGGWAKHGWGGGVGW